MNKKERVTQEIMDVKGIYPELHQLQNNNEDWILWGPLLFQAEYNKQTIEDLYYVEISIPSNYPVKIPHAREVGGRIPHSFHTNLNGNLCLGAPLKNNRSFARKKTILGFIENCLIPFLFAYSYLGEFGELPFGELAHGHIGIIQCYEEEFQTKDVNLIIDFLSILAQYDFPGYIDCPCLSGKKLWKCHGKKILELKNLQLPEDFASELRMILNRT